MIVIPERLPSLNEYIDLCRRNKFAANKMKRDAMEKVEWWIRASREPKPTRWPVEIHITCYEPNARRDWDGTASMAMKVVLDAMQEIAFIPNDNKKHVWPVVPKVELDREYPRIEVEVVEPK